MILFYYSTENYASIFFENVTAFQRIYKNVS